MRQAVNLIIIGIACNRVNADHKDAQDDDGRDDDDVSEGDNDIGRGVKAGVAPVFISVHVGAANKEPAEVDSRVQEEHGVLDAQVIDFRANDACRSQYNQT